MKHERLDEVIDRVAAEMTAVPADLAFSERVRDRLQSRRSSVTPSWFVVATASALVAVAVLAVIVTRDRVSPPAGVQSPTPLLVTRELRPHEVFAPSVGNIASSVQSGQSGNVAADSEPESVVATVLDVDSPLLAALTVDELTVDDFDVEPLGIASLEIPAIDIGEEPKEPF